MPKSKKQIDELHEVDPKSGKVVAKTNKDGSVKMPKLKLGVSSKQAIKGMNRLADANAGKPAQKKKTPNGKKPVLRRIAWSKVSKMIKDFKKREAWLVAEVDRQKSKAEHFEGMTDHWMAEYRKHSKNVAELGKIVQNLEQKNEHVGKHAQFLRRVTESMMDYADLLKEQNKEINVELKPQHVSLNFNRPEHANCRCSTCNPDGVKQDD